MASGFVVDKTERIIESVGGSDHRGVETVWWSSVSLCVSVCVCVSAECLAYRLNHITSLTIYLHTYITDIYLQSGSLSPSRLRCFFPRSFLAFEDASVAFSTGPAYRQSPIGSHMKGRAPQMPCPARGNEGGGYKPTE